jgi:hypothetical protein
MKGPALRPAAGFSLVEALLASAISSIVNTRPPPRTTSFACAITSPATSSRPVPSASAKMGG